MESIPLEAAGKMPVRFGLALGSGGARGFAHCGFLLEMDRQGFAPCCISGTSMGALVGALYAGGNLKAFTKWVSELGPTDFFGLIDLAFPKHGLIDCEDLMEELARFMLVKNIEDCRIPLGIVASNGISGKEVVFRQGPILDAVRAAITLPGIIVPPLINGEPLLDGGMVNPVPVSVAREMGAKQVYAVDVSGDLLLRRHKNGKKKETPSPAMQFLRSGMFKITDMMGPAGLAAGQLITNLLEENGASGNITIFEAIMNSLSISQQALKNTLYRQNPPDALIVPDLGHLMLLDFHKAAEAVRIGEESAEDFFAER